jgi:hypothetical protein
MTNNQTTVMVLIVVLLVAAGAYLFYDYKREDVAYNPENEPAPEVPNGNENDDEEWQLANNSEFSFRYPVDSGSDYVEMTDWPPEVQLTDDEFTCTEAGAETDRAGRTDSVTIGGRDYCRTTVAEGAAGSTYRQYAYAFAHAEGTAIMTFSVRMPQCANYDGSEQTACAGQQAEFDTDILVDQMIDTFTAV